MLTTRSRETVRSVIRRTTGHDSNCELRTAEAVVLHLRPGRGTTLHRTEIRNHGVLHVTSDLSLKTVINIRIRYDQLSNYQLLHMKSAPWDYSINGSDDGVLYLKESVFLTFSIVQCFDKNTTFRKLDVYPSSVKIKVAPTLLGPLQRGAQHSRGHLHFT
jgi:hypothetical protein